MRYEIRQNKMGHYEVRRNKKVVFVAVTKQAAAEQVEKLKQKDKENNGGGMFG